MGRDRRDRDRRKRGRSRSRDRSKSKERSRSRDRERRDRDRKRDKRSRSKDSRSPSRSPPREKKRRDDKEEKGRERRSERTEKTETVDKPKDKKVEKSEKDKSVISEIVTMEDKSEADKELEKLMEERRKKVELWRSRHKAKHGEATEAVKEEAQEEKPKEEEKKKGWTLEDDDDEEEEQPKKEPVEEEEQKKSEEVPVVKKEESDEEDPLDAFMNNIKGQARKREPGGVRVVTIASDKKPEKEKGELLENDDNADMLVDDFDLESATHSLMAKARLLPQTDHTKVYYKPFKKEFYVEVPEVSRMTKKEVDAMRREMDNIKVRGKDVPKPVRTFAQCGVDRKILNVLKKMNYTKPTPIQAQAIPAVMTGRDVIGIAKTGSGKTLAFLLPMFRQIAAQDPLDEMDGPIGVIMSPTRELALQTWKEACKFAKQYDYRVVCVYGGVGISEQIADLKRGAEIVVCTPGRMIDMLAANNGKVTNLRRCTYLVLDEADRMFDMGFEPQVMKIVNNIRPDRQTVLFSATFPRQMEALARKILVAPIEIEVGGKSIVCSDIEQHAMIVEEHQKFLKLLELLGIYSEAGNCIVFVDKQEKADDLVVQLMRSGYDCAPLHGGIDQFDRDSTITDFKSGKVKILITTSVAARGLDVKNMILVVNFDCPNHYEDYVHRVGRTGRAGNKGYAYTFILPENQEKMAGEICKAFEGAGQEPPADVANMFGRFKAEMEAAGREVHLGNRGFSGSGFKYDEVEAEADIAQRRMTKLIHGMENAQDDNDEDDIDAQLTSLMKSKTRVVEGKMNMKNEKIKAAAESKMDDVRTRAAAIVASKNLNALPEKDDMQLAAEAVMKGEVPMERVMSAAEKARAIANSLNEKMNYEGGAKPFGEFGEDCSYFEEELDINDFPQQVRYRICSREVIGQICDFAEVGMSVKGSYYPPHKEPKEGDRRLTIFLEARQEAHLRRAKDEILRLIKDCIRSLAGGMRAAPSNRYRVL